MGWVVPAGSEDLFVGEKCSGQRRPPWGVITSEGPFCVESRSSSDLNPRYTGCSLSSDPDSSLRAFLLFLVQPTSSSWKKFLLILPRRASAGLGGVPTDQSEWGGTYRGQWGTEKARVPVSPRQSAGYFAGLPLLSTPGRAHAWGFGWSLWCLCDIRKRPPLGRCSTMSPWDEEHKTPLY